MSKFYYKHELLPCVNMGLRFKIRFTF